MNLRMRTLALWLTLSGLGAVHAGTLADLDGALKGISTWKPGQGRAGLMAASNLVRDLAQDPAQRGEAEKRLVAMLGSDATPEAKAFVCQELSLIGSAECVPALAKLLSDEALGLAGRSALERIPGPEAAAALREALPRLKGLPLVGLVNSIGRRHDAEAVPALSRLAAGQDEAAAAAALAALGETGGPEAAKALAEARTKVPEELRPVADDAYLLCADQLVSQGKKAEAAAIYRSVQETAKAEAARVAAFRGMLATGEQAAWQLIAASLAGEDARMQAVAAGFAREIPGTEATRALAAELPKISPRAQVLLLGALAARGDGAARPAVLEAARSKDEAVRVAALDALGPVGDASCVPLLAGAAAGAAGAEQAAAFRSLVALRGPDVEKALVAAMQGAEPAARVVLVRALAARGTASALPALLQATGDPEPAVRTEAIKALATMGDATALPPFLALLAKATDAAERDSLEKAIARICGRVADKEEAAAPVLAAMAQADEPTRASLLHILGRIASPRALAAVHAALKDPAGGVQDAAVRALADWPDPGPMPDLLAIARTDPSQTHKVLALRGLVRMAALPGDRPAGETARLFADAMATAARPEDRKLVLAGLGNVADPAALDLALASLADPALEAEAAAAAIEVAKALRTTHPKEAVAAVERIIQSAKTPAVRQAAETALIQVGSPANIAPEGTATSPDGLEGDGAAGGDQAGIDGDPATYWDEEDGQELYRYVVTFKAPQRIAALSILGYQQHSFAPRDFEVLCDGKVVKKVTNAKYSANLLVVRLGEVTARSVELKISGYYGGSPAIRELGIYPPGAKAP